MTDVSDSIGVAFAFDLFIALITDETLRANNQVIMKSLKNRFGEIEVSSLVGIDYQKMRFYNIEDNRTGQPAPVIDKPLGSNKTGSKFKSFDF